ncbi:MAG TPA: lytic murein transglycosylase [Syntrophorhabdaceae bacterium]|nr:lytic murein transglycosylase [Syntrophorhabdaceae bacterium]
MREKLRGNGFLDEELNLLFSDNRVTVYPPVVEKTGKGLDYFGTGFGLLTKRSLKLGRDFLKRNEDFLEDLQKQSGVEKEILLAILRVETNFGANTGKYPIFNSLLSMILIENRRTDWAEEEFRHLLVFSRQQGKDPLAIRGSWAGAFGMCQFVPSSYVNFAVDGDGDGLVDLFNSHDALASTANYLKRHGYNKESEESKKAAIYAYNHCDSYVEAVLTYARALR